MPEADHTGLVEIRIPTYKRPALLKRALDSLISQTHPNWVTYVLDDSEEAEAKAVVESYQDSRIIYSPNDCNLGGTQNIDRAFSSNQFGSEELSKAQFAYVLEDDNWLMPEFLEKNCLLMQSKNLNILFRNQIVASMEGEPSTGTTLTSIYSEGMHKPEDCLVRLFYSGAISNGSLFWRLDAGVDFYVGAEVTHSVQQENLRALAVREPFYVALTPYAYWAESDETTINFEANRTKRFLRKYEHLRGVSQIRQEAWRRLSVNLAALDLKKLMLSVEESAILGLARSGVWPPVAGSHSKALLFKLWLGGKLFSLWPTKITPSFLNERFN